MWKWTVSHCAASSGNSRESWPGKHTPRRTIIGCPRIRNFSRNAAAKRSWRAVWRGLHRIQRTSPGMSQPTYEELLAQIAKERAKNERLARLVAEQSGSGALAQGTGATAAGEGGVALGRDNY